MEGVEDEKINVEVKTVNGTFHETFLASEDVLLAVKNAGYEGTVMCGGDPLDGGSFEENGLQEGGKISVVAMQDEAPPNLKSLGFPDEHLELLEEFITRPDANATWLGHELPLTWEAHEEYWVRKITGWEEHERKQERSLIQWPKGFNANCTDASQPRYLKALPGENIRCSLDYVNKETTSSCIIQYMVGIDHLPRTTGERGDISEICRGQEQGLKNFHLRAPDEPGLYMIWCKGAYHYSFRQAAAEQWPETYSGCDKWYGGFISWLRVDSEAKGEVPAEQGPWARYETPKEGWS